MIEHIASATPWITTSNGNNPLPYISSGEDLMRGVIRVMNGRMEAWSGAGWLPILPNSAYIDISENAKSVLQWAEKKMQEEATALALAEKYPAVADAIKDFKQAEEKLSMLVALTKENI